MSHHPLNDPGRQMTYDIKVYRPTRSTYIMYTSKQTLLYLEMPDFMPEINRSTRSQYGRPTEKSHMMMCNIKS